MYLRFILAAAFVLLTFPVLAAECNFQTEKEYYDYLKGAKYFETWRTDHATGKKTKNRIRFSGTLDNPIIESKITKPGGSLKKARWWVQPKPKIIKIRIFQFNNGDNPTGVAVSTVRTSKKCRTYYYPNNENNLIRVE